MRAHLRMRPDTIVGAARHSLKMWVNGLWSVFISNLRPCKVLVELLHTIDDGQRFFIQMGIILLGFGRSGGGKPDRLLLPVWHSVGQHGSQTVGRIVAGEDEG